MNNRILIALPLAAVLAFPALAQTSSSQDQSAPAAPSTTQSTDTATGKAPLAPPSREGFWGRVNPFARKNYVKRQTDPIRDRVNELDDLTACQQQGDQRHRLARPGWHQAGFRQGRSRPISTPSTPATRRPWRSRPRKQATTRIQTVETVVGNIDQYKASNQTEIRFRPGQTVLSKNAKDALDEMANAVKGPARLHHRSAGLLVRQGPGGHPELAEDGRVGGALPRAQPRDSGLPHLSGRDGQCPHRYG